MFNIGRYDQYPISIPRNSKSALTKEKTHSRVWEHTPTHVPIQDENEKEEDWHMDDEDDHIDFKKDDIQDAVDLNMDEIEDEVDIQEIVKE
jgi:hypothetical protein